VAARKRGKKRPFGNVSKAKARKILKDGTAQGRPLSARQKRALGARIGGKR
jgi:hypothetical protein